MKKKTKKPILELPPFLSDDELNYINWVYNRDWVGEETTEELETLLYGDLMDFELLSEGRPIEIQPN